jgi:hypothetical protein
MGRLGSEMSAMMSATKENAFVKNAEAAPHHPIKKPASDGPIRRDP